jgi:hypothetical protein
LENKTYKSLFADDMIVCGKFSGIYKKFFKLITEFSNTAEYKNKVYLYILATIKK